MIAEILQKQRAFADSNKARDVDFRLQQLRKLKGLLKIHEEQIYEAIYLDFKKSRLETYMTELALIHGEIDDALKHLKKWSRPKRVRTGLANFPAQSYIIPEPYGNTLIIGAWNYPYQLTLVPLVSAIAAGNTAIIKPSEAPARTARVMAEIINSNFDPGYLHVIEGGVEVSQELLKQKYDKIFFTGSTAVGRIVAEAAAQYLTPVTLELGGKSPCFVLEDADIPMTAQRIAWGKFLNAGQTCIAPDYLLVQENIAEYFLKELKAQTEKLLGPAPPNSENYPQIINQKHVQRLKSLIDPQKVFFGGQVDESNRYIAPTILKNVSFSDEVMKEEIFGPILPVLTFKNLQSAMDQVKQRPRPLALYVFSKNKKLQDEIVNGISFGGGSINDVVMHISNSRLPFGGVGESGMGSYHGEMGFKAFSHHKSILKKSFLIEPPIKYPPYSRWKLTALRWILGNS